jgi:hypothetical protein
LRLPWELAIIRHPSPAGCILEGFGFQAESFAKDTYYGPDRRSAEAVLLRWCARRFRFSGREFCERHLLWPRQEVGGSSIVKVVCQTVSVFR